MMSMKVFQSQQQQNSYPDLTVLEALLAIHSQKQQKPTTTTTKAKKPDLTMFDAPSRQSILPAPEALRCWLCINPGMARLEMYENLETIPGRVENV